MATSQQFSDMLRTYMPYNLLVEEMKKRNYFWKMVKKDPNWYGGTLDVPFEGGEYSSLSFGALPGSSDIAQATEVLGTVSTQPELWGSMLFYEKDLDRHKSLEHSFLKIIPGKIEQFTERMAERVSLTLLNGYIAKVTDATDAASGLMVVDHPERFTIGEKITLNDDNTTAAEYYITAININTKTLTISDTRGGSVTNVSAFSVAQNAKIYLPNGDSDGFTSLASSLLSSTNGGGSTLYGQTKTSYPFLQAQQHDGSSVTAVNVLDKVYDFFFAQMALGKGRPTEVLMSMTHFKNCAKSLENSRRFAVSDRKAGYGWASIELIGGPAGSMKITGIRDMGLTEMFIMDWSAMKFHGNNFFQRKRHFDNEEFYLTRATTGYTYIVDIKFFGDLIVNKPSHCGVVHSIPSTIT